MGNELPKTDKHQDAVLEALGQGMTDPQQIREFAGLPTLAAVKRTIDKLSLRKEYHAALEKNGMTLDWIVKGVKAVADDPTDPKTRLSAFKMLIGSMGLDKFEDMTVGGKDWEDTLLRLQAQQAPAISAPDADYEVHVPERPDSVKQMRDADKKLAQELLQGKLDNAPYEQNQTIDDTGSSTP